MEIDKIFKTQKENFTLNKSVGERIDSLRKLKSIILDNRDRIAEAINTDFSTRCKAETDLCEIMTTVGAISYIIKHIKKWAAPQKRRCSILFFPAKNQVQYQAKGIVGIISPWNYPLFLSMVPLAYSIAAGNSSMVKISEHTPRTGALLDEILSKYFSLEMVKVINGNVKLAQDFSKLAFDHIFFTGSQKIGKLIMQEAAKNLTPVTLELGGKSPVIIDEKYNIKKAAKIISFGKLINAGQTCIAPDYVYCHESKKEDLVDYLLQYAVKMYPNAEENNHFTSIINELHYKRISHYIDDARSKGASIYQSEAIKNFHHQKKIPFTIITETSNDMTVMKEEIFGPVLPIKVYTDYNDVIKEISTGDKPLALYFFSNDKYLQKKIIQSTTSGGVCINDTLSQVAQEDMPFGGIGASGMGNYHGFEGFQTFSHARSIHYKKNLNTSILVYPPHNSILQRLVYKVFIR